MNQKPPYTAKEIRFVTFFGLTRLTYVGYTI
jgi:hypothetical protein